MATKPTPNVLIGLPYLAAGPLAAAAGRAGARVLVSAGSMFRAPGGRNRAGFGPINPMAWRTAPSLDSAGFTAMKLGGYRWSVSEYVAFIVTNSGDGAMPFPWRWWSAMDYCVEPEIAADRAEVERRISLTIESYGDTLDELNAWRAEGVTDVPDPMPILQGRNPADYVDCARRLAEVIDARHGCTCPCGDEDCAAEWHRATLGLPELVGLGSVCRRQVHGPDGLIAVLEALDQVLPAHVRLHLFGVKGQALPHLARFAHRIASLDSMAWDTRARVTAREEGVKNTVERRAAFLEDWARRQAAQLEAWNTETETTPTDLEAATMPEIPTFTAQELHQLPAGATTTRYDARTGEITTWTKAAAGTWTAPAGTLPAEGLVALAPVPVLESEAEATDEDFERALAFLTELVGPTAGDTSDAAWWALQVAEPEAMAGVLQVVGWAAARGAFRDQRQAGKSRKGHGAENADGHQLEIDGQAYTVIGGALVPSSGS